MAIKFLNTVQVDTDVLYVDATNDSVGIGTTSVGTESNLYLGASGSNEGGQITLQKATNGTLAAHIDAFTSDGKDFMRILSGGDTSSTSAPFVFDLTNVRVGIGTNNPLAKLQVEGKAFINGQIYGGFGALTTNGTLDWDDSTNARSGNGHTLLRGNATNGPAGSEYYHSFSWEYAGYDNDGNMTQFAIPYSTNNTGMYYRSRYNGTWTGWAEIVTTTKTLPGGPYLPLTGGTLSGNLTIAHTTNPYLYLNDTNAGAGIFQQEGNTTRIGSDTNTQVVLVQNNSTAVTINTSKNVGIGTTSPTEAKLVVEGTSEVIAAFGRDGTDGDTVQIYNGLAGTTKVIALGASGNDGTIYSQYGDLLLQQSAGRVGIGTNSPGEKLEVNGNIKVDNVLLSNQQNTDVSGLELVANVLIASYTAAFFDFVIKKGTNVRSGTVYACHDGTNVEFTETSTQDLGDTSDVVLSVDISGTGMRLLADAATSGWSVKSLIRAI